MHINNRRSLFVGVKSARKCTGKHVSAIPGFYPHSYVTVYESLRKALGCICRSDAIAASEVALRAVGLINLSLFSLSPIVHNWRAFKVP